MAALLLGNESPDSNRLILVNPKSENDVRLQATLGNQNPTGLPVGAVSCGEWCMFNSYAVGVDTHGGQSTLNGLDFSQNTEKFTPEEKKEIYLSIVSEQLEAWKAGSGYFYWNYKLLLDTVNDPNWIGWDSWDLGKCVDQGWFPVGG